MGKLRWYARDPRAALDGMLELNLEERGAYNTVLDLIYDRDGKLPDDDRFVAGWLRCDVRVWRRIKSRLVTLGKLYVADGLLRNPRADVEVLKALARVVAAADAGKQSAVARGHKSEPTSNGSNEIAPTDVPTDAPTVVSTTYTNKDIDKKALSSLRSDSPSAPADDPQAQFDQFWAAWPRKVKKPSARKAFKTAIKKTSIEDIVSGVQRYISTKPSWQDYCHPSSWLNDERWADEENVGQGEGVNYHKGGRPERGSILQSHLNTVGTTDDDGDFFSHEDKGRKLISDKGKADVVLN